MMFSNISFSKIEDMQIRKIEMKTVIKNIKTYFSKEMKMMIKII